jgi:hypothetical protein
MTLRGNLVSHKWVGNPDFVSTTGKYEKHTRCNGEHIYGNDGAPITPADIFLHEKHTRVLLDKLYEKHQSTSSIAEIAKR